ncbi:MULTISPECIES: TetR/AcrR family transcriptional regulator [unclassified Microbacterium]|uniref:TetR/AcrR family transcriptional regulator n=1 Tax=unclassified Microbacterium TaxID=2609290 RepID=UPI00214B8343|nr:MULTISPECIES: TetR/AcrR family transcriptional regulator [unclassified Microbacterium]MCR2800110.1 TetR/AcrR family transcriptional regulator [Microbacterium sp. zg.Y818]MCR2828286.1 TetR/AcrR family transcriptional regulator [Microbacterium sp. zg.Y909]WIM22081.1 helix-turn-helix domain-containing protein [Microbacterium sp. zg-Y818]
MGNDVEVSRKVNRGRAAGPENRRALLRAAREVFAEYGLSAPFSAVAKRAGVGQGSLYRHFPDRTALAAALFEENVAAIEAHTAPDDRTLEDLFDVIVDQAVVSTALIDLMVRNRHDAHVVALGDRFRQVVDRLLVRERQAGHVGAHVDTADIMLAVGMLAGELARTDEADRADVAVRARRQFRRAFAP